MKWENLYTPCEEQGRIECVRYCTRAYALEHIYKKECIPLEKSMYVYLPYNYDAGKKYNVLYLMHGGTEDEGYWFGKGRYDGADTEMYTDMGNVTQNVVDHLIQDGMIDPLIIVTPSFCEDVEEYRNREEYPAIYFDVVNYFWLELKRDILPYIQTHYATYAEDATEAAFVKARKHCAYAGVSQGSITGLNSVMLHMADYVAYIGSISAGSIRHGFDGKELKVEPDEGKIEEIADALKKSQRLAFWYNGCGDNDMMYESHRATYDAMLKACPEKLQEDVDGNGNCAFRLQTGGEHRYRYWIHDLYNVLNLFFH